MEDSATYKLKDEIEYLRSLLEEHGIGYDYGEYCRRREADRCGESVPIEISAEVARFFFSMFHGRVDVYARRSREKGYFPQCENLWKIGVCPKREAKRTKCSECPSRAFASLNTRVIMQHMRGDKSDCTDVIGIYVMLKDDTCRFIVFDFDNHDKSEENSKDWQDEVDALRRMCACCGIDCLVERSRSGNGAHVWIFFSEAVPAYKARLFGNALVTKGADTVSIKTFRYYDRLLPMQDTLPEGGLGNLIALPWQGQAIRRGNSVFVDEDWRPLPDQLRALRNARKLSLRQIDAYIAEWHVEDAPYGQLQEEKKDDEVSEDWLFHESRLQTSDASGPVRIILRDGVRVLREGLRPRLQNAIRRLAAYSNPDFYKKLKLGFSTLDVPRIVYCGYDDEEAIVLPRGCGEPLFNMLDDAGIQYDITDNRQEGRPLRVSFNGELFPEQSAAAGDLLSYENGVLNAATAFGKTVVGAYLIATRKVNALVLVHNVEIMNNWVKDLERFLTIDENLPSYTTPTGRVKFRKSHIGTFGSQSDKLTGLIDVAMITSLGKDEDINPIVKNYGMVIMDECHHAAAYTSESVLRAITAKYVYGLTATMKRDDGQERKILMQIGPVRHRYTAKDRAKKQGIGHYVYPRFTRLVDVAEKSSITDVLSLVAESEIRNLQIVSDAIDCIRIGRTPIVITKRKEHAARLYELLKDSAQHIFLLQGGGGSKARAELRERMAAVPKNETMLVVAIGQYIGEGFNYPRLDTLLLAMPISFENNVEQYAGRLNRDYEGKKDVIVFDYIDQYVPVLERMYNKRLRTYRRIGFDICAKVADSQHVENSIFDAQTYREVFDGDIRCSESEVIISSPWLSSRVVRQFVKSVAELQERGVKVTVMTLFPSKQPEYVAAQREALVAFMRHGGITVYCSEKCREHFAVIDRSLVWYGSIDFLSYAKEDDNVMRIASASVAQELLEGWAKQTG